jgi:hypothetical protein
MAARSIGVLSLFINADAAGLMRTFNQVDRRLARTSRSWTKPGAKLALGFLGVQNALTAVSNEIRHVVANIEDIPGVPATATASIITFRDNLASAKTWIDQMTASAIGFGAEFAQAVGVGAAGMMGFDDTSALSALPTPDEIARSRDSGFDAKVQAARKRFIETQKEADLATKSEAAQIRALREEAQRYETFSESAGRNTLERIEARTEAQEKLAEANKKMATLNKQLAESEKEVAEAMTGAYVATLPLSDSIAGLEQRTSKIFTEMAGVSTDKNDPEAVQRRIELNQELAKVQEQLGKLYEKQGELGREAGEIIAGGFEDALISGGKLSDLLSGLATDLARLLIRNSITGPLGNWLGGILGGNKGAGGAGGIFGGIGKIFGFANGGNPPVGVPSMVGENGPELIVPRSASTVIPNHALGGNTYYIDARGADEGAVRRIEGALLALAGPGVVERRAVAATRDFERRRG